MLGLEMLDVAIGVVFVFLLLSLVCSAINELVESKLKLRAVDLEQGIRVMLDDYYGDNFTQQIYNHPLVYSLFKGEYNPNDIRTSTDKAKIRYSRGSDLPSYIPATNFALALIDTINPPDPGNQGGPIPPAIAIQNFRTAVNNIGDNDKLKQALLTIIDTAGTDMTKLRQGIEGWFNSSMDRVSGWYKKRVQKIVFVMGFVISIIMNADTIAIFTSLSNDRPLRDAVVTAAKDYKDPSTDTMVINERIQQNLHSLQQLGLPIGWGWHSSFNPDRVPNPRAIPSGLSAWILKFFGWLLTGMAVSLGAPFWFDVLNKIMVVRSTVKPHEKSPEEASQDRQ